ncbi:hypothetical protein P7K49_037507 [Saguinus oedipus]|uniref:Ig-like domain-containing protein n=1 Tax=Saguinus oedipus TaxID=9490 RepID=A0ABQ9TIB9_SAGOE|nr:hypothetical protein P7K49_037507 [Saguinus oedipus]
MKDSGNHIHLKRIRGGSVLFNVTEKPTADAGAEIQEVSWGLGTLSNHRQVLQVHRGADSPIWFSLQDKFKQRVHVPSMWSLRIENLAPEDSGQYVAMTRSTQGRVLGQVFYLSTSWPNVLPHKGCAVPGMASAGDAGEEHWASASPSSQDFFPFLKRPQFSENAPVPHPEILAKSLSITPGLCNITLECRVPGATQDLNVTWKSKGLFRELEQRDIPGPTSKLWTLAVSLPLSQQIGDLTCVVSNQVDQKAATLELGKVCAQGTGLHKQDVTRLLPGILGAVVGVLLVLGSGLYVLKTCQKKKKMVMEIKRGGGLQKNHGVDDGGIPFETLSQQVSQKGKDKTLTESPNITAGCCNITVEGKALGTTKGLNMTWESKGLPRKLEQSGTPGLATKPWTLAVSLPKSEAAQCQPYLCGQKLQGPENCHLQFWRSLLRLTKCQKSEFTQP